MTTLRDRFEQYSDEFLKFDRIPIKTSQRPDLHAFNLLDKLLPGKSGDMVCHAEHDEIFLDVDPEELAKAATDDQIMELVRCGVRYDSSTDSVAMFT